MDAPGTVMLIFSGVLSRFPDKLLFAGVLSRFSETTLMGLDGLTSEISVKLNLHIQSVNTYVSK